MDKRAVKIDLSTFFEDERKMTFILIDSSWKRVECLQKRVEFLFNVDSVRFLSDGYFLPPQEPIEIVKFCNDLKAFVPKKFLENKKIKKSKKLKKADKSFEDGEYEEETTATNSVEPIEELQRKRKFNSVNGKSLANSLSTQAKRSKNCISSEITSTSEQISPLMSQLVNEESSKKSKVKQSKILNVTSDCEEQVQKIKSFKSNCVNVLTENSLNLEENTIVPMSTDCQSTERHSSTPEENVSEVSMEKPSNDETKATATCSHSIPSSTFLHESNMKVLRHTENVINSHNQNNPFRKPKTNKTHIYFDESGEISSPIIKSRPKSLAKENKEPKAIVIFRCPLNNVTNATQPQKPRIFHLKPKKNKTEKQLVEINEHIILTYSMATRDTFGINESEKEQQITKALFPLEETASSPEKCTLNNTSVFTESTSIVTNDDTLEKTVNQNLEASHAEKFNVTCTKDEEKQQPKIVKKVNTMDVDCVDLSVEENEDVAVEILKEKSTQRISKVKSPDQKYLIADDGGDSNASSDIEEISEIIDLNETEDNNDHNGDTTVDRSTAESDNLDQFKVDRILPFATDMTELPNIGDVVLLKIPYAKAKKQCENTNYLSGRVEYVNRRTKSIKLLVIDGASELYNVSSKFTCNMDDSQHNITHVQIKLSEMVEPKLFSMS